MKLIESLPVAFQSVFERIQTNISNQSTYYLVFGRQLPDTEGRSKVWIDFNLPDLEEFPCINEQNINQIRLQIQAIGNSISSAGTYDFVKAETDAMDFLKRRIACAEICDNGIDDDGDGWIDCNDPDCFEFYERNRSASS